MVFLVQDCVNLPADQMKNIWMAAHMKKKLNKKDIKKTKLGAACSQLHSSKTKKPMQLRHYGQCLIGISWIHLKQVEYLHSDCTDAFSKARLVLVRKRNVDLDPSDSNNRGKDIDLPAQKNRRDEEVLDIDLNAVNFSQLDMDFDDNASEMGSVLDSINQSDNLALDHEITMQQNELTTVSPRLHDRRSSFGGMSSILMGDLGDMDIEIRFDDDDDDEVLEESQAKKASNDTMASLSVTDNNSQVEQGRGANNHTLLHNDNMSDNGSALHGQSGPADMRLSLLSDNHSQVSLAKEKSALHLDDMSLHSGSHLGSAIMHAIPENMDMDIDDASLMDDQQSLHVQFDLDASQSVNGSVATALVEPREEATPPSSPRGAVSSQNQHGRVAETAASKPKKGKAKKKKVTKKRKRKDRFPSDAKIELSAEELRVAENDMENAPFMFPSGRDALHIWREFPLSSLSFEELLNQPLSRHQFGRFTEDIAKRFALCLEKPRRKGEGPIMGGGASDELANLDILREHDDDVEKGRDADDASDVAQGDLDHHNDINNDMSLQMNDFSMNDMSLQMDQHGMAAINESVRPLIDNDDNHSTLDSVMDDHIPAPRDPLYNENVADLTMPGELAMPLPDDESALQLHEGEHDDEDEDDEDMEMPGAESQKLSFGTEDQNILTQMDDVMNVEALMRDGIKPRDWSVRAKKCFSYFKNKPGEEFSFNELMKPGTKRQTVVGVFYELLVFKNSDLVELQQEEPYGDITITKTPNFHLHARVSQQMSQRQ